MASHTVQAHVIDLLPGTLKAWVDKQPGVDHADTLHVTVDAFVEVDWKVEIVSAVPQGINPAIKLLNLNVTLPSGPVHSNAIAKRTLTYAEPHAAGYHDVTLLNGPESMSANVGIIV